MSLKKPENKILDATGQLILSGLVILIVTLISSAYFGMGLFIFGIACFMGFACAAMYLPDEDIKKDACLSCGRSLLKAKKCMVCGAGQEKRVTELQLVAVACSLLLIGVVFIGAAYIYSDTRITPVNELQETDNFRQIRVVGKVTDIVDYYPEKYDETGTIRMLVNDGTGDIYVKITPGVSKEFILIGYIPGFGDTVDCEGSLFVGDEGYMQIKVRDKSLFRIIDTVPRNITMNELVPSDRDSFGVGEKITVEGQIQGKFYIEGFAWILDLGDNEGRQVSVFIPDSITALTGELDMNYLYLSQVRVTGALEWYESGQSWEIIPTSSKSIEVLSTYTGDTYTVLKVSEFLANASAYQNEFVEFQNVTCAWHYADYLFSVTDATSYLEVSVFVDYDANVSAGFGVGDKMSVRGWVTFYDENNNNIPDEGEWEIKIRALSSDFALTEEDIMGGGL